MIDALPGASPLVAHLVFGAPDWLLPAGAAVVAAWGIMLFRYRGLRSGSWRMAAMSLKATGLLALAACLVEPLWSGTRPRPGENLFLLAADDSQSLTIRDESGQPTRGERLQSLLTPETAAWRTRLAQDFDVRPFLVGESATAVPDFQKLTFASPASSLSQQIDTLAARFHQRPVAGILLFTDGLPTDLDPQKTSLPSGCPPVYPVIVAAESPPVDLALTNVAVTQSAFEDAPLTLLAEVRTQGLTKEPVTVRLLDEAGTVVAKETQSVTGETATLAFRFQLRPAGEGLMFYRVVANLQTELPAEKEAESTATSKVETATREATLANNQRLVRVDRGSGPYRVLYVSGRPNWEFKFLRRALDADTQVQLVGLIRIAKREPKFDWRGRAGEGTNPLFRGFEHEETEKESAEKYDQPVLVRLNTEDAAELRDGFPKTAAELYRYHAVILDDIEAEFFTRDQQQLIEKFVSERGGGLLMLGGQESFRNGGYDRTPLGDLLPAYLEQVPPARPGTGYRLSLTRDGWLQPWVRLRSNEPAELARLEAMPEFLSISRVGHVKPGAQVLAHVENAAGEQLPALLSQRYGRGRSAALAIADFWRWGLRREPETDDLAKTWRQTLRWLVADVPAPLTMTVQEAAERVELQVRARNPEFAPLDNATVRLTVRTPAGESITLPAEPSLKEAGLYTAAFVPRESGAFRAAAEVLDGDGQPAGAAATGWVADPIRKEFATLEPNRKWLEEIARSTGGEVIPADRLEAFVQSLPNRKLPIVETWTMPLWHQPYLFLFALVCLSGEWWLRRRNGAA